jgi:hypothetical protein
MFDFLDNLWETIKRKWPKLQLWDQTFDQSHVQHTLVCLLLFGTVGMFYFGIRDEFGLWLFGRPLATGIYWGFIFYFIREILNRVGNWTYNLWDGTLDILMPVFILGPWCTVTLTTIPTPKIGLFAYIMGGFISWMYSFGRPNILHYDKSKD